MSCRISAATFTVSAPRFSTLSPAKRPLKEKPTSNALLSATLENLRAMTGRMKLVDLETGSWNAALATYKEHVAVYDFSGAGAAINAVQITDSALKKSQTAMLRKAQWLADWKNKLIVDLTRAHFSGSIADIDGARYNGIVGADPEKLMLKTRYGIVGLPWAKLQPKKLLAVSASFIWPEARDAGDRQWLCAVFANETGQTDAARQFAESAAKAKPKYREQIPLLLPAPSPSR